MWCGEVPRLQFAMGTAVVFAVAVEPGKARFSIKEPPDRCSKRECLGDGAYGTAGTC